MEKIVEVEMKPCAKSFDLAKTALILIDFQRDFLEPGGFGSALGNDVSKLQRAVAPCRDLLKVARERSMLVIHTREGHRSDLSDVTAHKMHQTKNCIGTEGPKGRILVRGQVGHDIIPELTPLEGEPVVDKPGKGSFYATDLELILKARGIETLFVCGVTTEVCVHTTVREANDRGFHCIVVEDCCASYIDEFHEAAIKMIWAQGGIFGSVADSARLLRSLKAE